MKKISYATLYGCINAVLLDHSNQFEEGIMLLIRLKTINLKNNVHRSGSANSWVKMPRRQYRDQADGCNSNMQSEIFKQFKDNERISQDLIKKFNDFFVSQRIPLPRIFEYVPKNSGKFQSKSSHQDPYKNMASSAKTALRSRGNNRIRLTFEVGHVNMTPQELAQNMKLTITCIVSSLDNEWDDIQTLHIKSTSGQPHRLY